MKHYRRSILIIFIFLFQVSSYSQTAVNPEKFVPYRIANKWGYSNREGILLIKPQYDSASLFYEERAIVKAKNLFYLINSKNTKITKTGFYKMCLLECCGVLLSGKKEVLYEVTDKARTFIIDLDGKEEIDCRCQEQEIKENLSNPLIKDSIIGDSNYWYFANDPQKKIYNWIANSDAGYIFKDYYVVQSDSLFGLIFNDGNEIKQIFNTEYDNILPWFKNFYERHYIVRKKGKESLITETKVVVPFKYKKIVPTDKKYELFLVETENGKLGFINYSGFEYFEK